ncbi:hypothetical protein DSO57_1029077 [Entomophthora muscae]|uniref:Uncharacterized protein n=2 Tax=Entomophthora muscae TaxID=34485 RepID=A0ACC2UB16_9FUNG|nr:hypothetical protein DSO57_1029076 [Entomophthora muscae]KAJ9083961.1 hypothetical protein DSO57_1029077 [Entomophthora muscae]
MACTSSEITIRDLYLSACIANLVVSGFLIFAGYVTHFRQQKPGGISFFVAGGILTPVSFVAVIGGIVKMWRIVKMYSIWLYLVAVAGPICIIALNYDSGTKELFKWIGLSIFLFSVECTLANSAHSYANYLKESYHDKTAA